MVLALRATRRACPEGGRWEVSAGPTTDDRGYECVLTDKGAELVDLLMVMVARDDRWLAGKPGPPVLYRHHACGEISSVEPRCTHCGEPMHAGDVELIPGPGAAA
jgi:hypothetical protein